MRVSSAAGKSERIKTHQSSFYAPNLKEHVMQQWGSKDKVWIPKMRPSEPSFGISQLLGHLPGLPWDQPQFRAPPDSPLGGRTPPQSMMRCPRRPIGPHPLRSMPLFNWIHSPESKTSTPSEEALVRGTSYVQFNPLTLPNTRS
ncbi:hypothetical protein M9H77_03201 [Catharanthus roseus]|uniref:Uncharacterized protein n=1 Tax=Catharanthus roseus TaxID=4058 RepID=A0ACC0CB20_CATRO|nr:hypothetical protein M9H77_03201 [Catharanthus roseus]